MLGTKVTEGNASPGDRDGLKETDGKPRRLDYRSGKRGKVRAEVRWMTGRNNRPDADGPAADPSRLDQFGREMAQEAKRELKGKAPRKGKC